jgi:hypothetical protein
MRFVIKLFVPLLAICILPGQDKEPGFEDYPFTQIFTGKPPAPILGTPEQRQFRSRIREGVRTGANVWRDGEERPGPNFAGHYIIVDWSFGSPGALRAMVDAESGRIYSLPLSKGLRPPDLTRGDPRPCWQGWGPASVDFRRNSRLMIVAGNGDPSKEQRNYKYFFLWESDRWMLLGKVPLCMRSSRSGRAPLPLVAALSSTRPGFARMDRLTIGPQVANLPHNATRASG